jgi:O-antigen ligase
LFFALGTGDSPPFRVPLYPILPIIYIASCGLLFQSSLTYANTITPYGGLIGFGIVLIGIPVYWLSKRMGSKPNS